MAGEFAAMVTAPVQKSAIVDAGIAFSGHTEFLAERSRSPHVVMMLIGGAPQAPLRVALATTHLPLRDVAAALTRDIVQSTLEIVARELKEKFALRAPRIAVCGLNPHAGESGHLGREDIDIIAPAIEAVRSQGVDIAGPILRAAHETLLKQGWIAAQNTESTLLLEQERRTVRVFLVPRLDNASLKKMGRRYTGFSVVLTVQIETPINLSLQVAVIDLIRSVHHGAPFPDEAYRALFAPFL